MDTPESLEWQRLAFVEIRVGMAATLTFARQGVAQYASALRESDSGGNQYGAAFRESLLASIRVYREYLQKNETPARPGFHADRKRWWCVVSTFLAAQYPWIAGGLLPVGW